MRRFYILPGDCLPASGLDFEVMVDAAMGSENEDFMVAMKIMAYFPVGSRGVVFADNQPGLSWCGKVVALGVVEGGFFDESSTEFKGLF